MSDPWDSDDFSPAPSLRDIFGDDLDKAPGDGKDGTSGPKARGKRQWFARERPSRTRPSYWADSATDPSGHSAASLAFNAPHIPSPIAVSPQDIDMDLVDRLAAARFRRMSGRTYGRESNPNTQTTGVLGELTVASWLSSNGATVRLTGEPDEGGRIGDTGDVAFTFPDAAVERTVEVKTARPVGWAKYGRGINAGQLRSSRADVWTWSVVRLEGTSGHTFDRPLPLRVREWPIERIDLMGWCFTADLVAADGHRIITWPSRGGGDNSAERWLARSPYRSMRELLD